MDKRLPPWSLQAVIGVAMGLALGIAIGWWLWPVAYTNISPAALPKDDQDEYVLMVAASYEVEQDVDEARSRLELLYAEEPSAPLIELAQRLETEKGNEEDVARLTRLAQVLEDADPSVTPDQENHG